MRKDYNVVFFQISSSNGLGKIFYSLSHTLPITNATLATAQNLQLVGQNLHFIDKTYIEKNSRKGAPQQKYKILYCQ